MASIVQAYKLQKGFGAIAPIGFVLPLDGAKTLLPPHSTRSPVNCRVRWLSRQDLQRPTCRFLRGQGPKRFFCRRADWHGRRELSLLYNILTFMKCGCWFYARVLLPSCCWCWYLIRVRAGQGPG